MAPRGKATDQSQDTKKINLSKATRKLVYMYLGKKILLYIPRPFITDILLMGRKESNQTKLLYIVIG